MVYKFFHKKSIGSGRPSSSAWLIVHNDTKQNLQLAKELHKLIIKKFYSGFKDNIWGADLADMELINKFNKGFRF